TVAAATGGSGTLTYQWQSSANGTSWTDISGATSANYTTPTLTANTYYRRNAIRATCGGTVSSASALVTVTANFTQGNPTAATICSGATNAFTLAVPTGGSGTITYNWQQSADNATWANATGTRNAANYTTPTLTSNMYYRRQATAATCGGTITSNAALVTVTPVLTTAAPAAVTICYNTATTFTVAAATGGSGTLTYQWQSSANGTSWTNISGATSANYTTPSLTANTYYRRNAIRATCGGTVSSASALVTVTANFTQGNPTATTINNGATAAFSLAAATGGSGTLTYQWEQSANNSTWENASGTSTNAAYTTPALTGNMYYRRKAISTTCGGTITSSAALVTVRACSAKPATPGAMTISTAAVLVNGTFTATVPAVTSGTLIPTSYTWSLPAGLTGSSTTNSITIKGVTVGTYAAGSIKVTAQNDCGTSDVASNTVTKTVLPSGTTTRSCGAIVYRFTGTVSYTNCPQSARPTTTCICSMGLPTYSNNWSATSATRYTTIGSTGCSENDSGGDVGQRECYQKVD
ncbi:MAG: hypothetical protein LBO74_02845, partial [Candidatus Symbiothrix sp.]|nr:hypothetical protein [Candidatus Symbiothrix sp.]